MRFSGGPELDEDENKASGRATWVKRKRTTRIRVVNVKF